MAFDYWCFYHSYKKSLRGLSDSEIGRLVLALTDYSETGKAPDLKGQERIAFDFIVADIDRAKKNYDKKCDQNRENALKRWDATAYDGMRTDTNGCEVMPTDAKHAKEKEKAKEKKKNNISLIPPTPQGEDGTDETDGIFFDLEDFKFQIEYDAIIEQYPHEDVDELLCIVEDVMTGKSQSVKIGGVDFPRHIVQKRLAGLTCVHVLSVLENRGNSKSRIKNIKAYLTTMLFNAPAGLYNSESATAEFFMRRENA